MWVAQQGDEAKGHERGQGDRFLIAEKCSSGNSEVAVDNLFGLSQFVRGVDDGW